MSSKAHVAWPSSLKLDDGPFVPMPMGAAPRREARRIDAMHTAASPAGLQVWQVSTDPRYASSHIYMESPVFTPDSRSFVFQRGSVEPSTIYMQRRRRQYWICDMDDDFAIRPLTDEHWAAGPAVSLDGQWCYYFKNRMYPDDAEHMELRRVSLRDGRRETVMVFDTPPAGAPFRPSRAYSLATIRADGGAIATGCFYGDGVSEPGVYGVLVADLQTGEARAPICGPRFVNTHPQYYRGSDPRFLQDLLVQENICETCNALGDPIGVSSGCYLRVVGDDGSDFRSVPTGHSHERCHGHQEWRGGQHQILVGVDHLDAENTIYRRPVILAEPVPDTLDSGVLPAELPDADGARRDLGPVGHDAWYAHTAFDLTGTLFATDRWDVRQSAETAELMVGTLPLDAAEPLRLRHLLRPMTNWGRDQFTHPHPCLSPDGRTLLFNSTYGGTPQVFLATGYDFP